MLRTLLLLSLVWNSIVPPARVCRAEPGEPIPVCSPVAGFDCGEQSAECCVATACGTGAGEPKSSRVCGELLCLLCPCRVPTTPQEPLRPAAKTVAPRVDSTVAAPFNVSAAPVRTITIDREQRVAPDAGRSHNVRQALFSVWLK